MTSHIVDVMLRWLPALACSLIMLWCMRGMSGRSCDQRKQEGAGGAAGTGNTGGERDAEIHALKTRLARLEATAKGPAEETRE